MWSPWVVVFKLWSYPTIVISIMAYVYGQYWWIVSLMTMEPMAYEDKSPQIQGVLFLGLLIGVLFAEVFCSGHASDKLVMFLAKRNNNERQPEMRLWLGYPAAVLSAVGCILWGLSVEREWHWIVGQVAFFLCEFLVFFILFFILLLFLFFFFITLFQDHTNLTDATGLQIGNTVVTTYMVDNYPDYVNELSVFYSCIINVRPRVTLLLSFHRLLTCQLSAFLVPWFIYDWTEHSGKLSSSTTILL